jgi:hypothetical protein
VKAGFLAAAICLTALFPDCARCEERLFREDFSSLESWEPLTFPKIESHSRYAVEKNGEQTVLRAESDASASGLSWKGTYNVYDYPLIRWRWKAMSTYAGGDALRRSGDDYPLRIYVVFPYDRERVGFGERLKYNAARLVYGAYPPLAAINYIWANRQRGPEPIPNAYTAKAVMIPLRGPDDTGQWHVETANVLADYRRAFGGDPPPEAGLAVMNDGDDTGEGSVSYIDYIEVYR